MLGLGNSLSRGGVLSGFENKYSLDFDGSDPYVDVGTAYNGVKSISFLLKVDDVTSNTDYILGLNDTDYISVVDSTVTLSGFSGGTNTIYVDASEASTVDTAWHHILITSTTARNASNCDLGRTQSNDSYNMVGNLDEVAFTSDVKSASDFADGTTPLDISGLSNLQNWWRMGDGVLDDFNLIADQVNPTLGSECTTNGSLSAGVDGEDATSWIRGTGVGWSYDATNDYYSWDDSGSGGFRQITGNMAISIVAGKTYKLTFTVSGISSTGKFGIFDYATAKTYVATADDYVNGDYTRYFTAPASSDGGIAFYAYAASSSALNIGNISVKEVNGNPGLMTNMASDDIVKDTP